MIIQVGNSTLEKSDMVDIYYNYICNLLQEWMMNNPDKTIHIYFHPLEIPSDLDPSVIPITLNYEHTLVKEEGRGTQGALLGNVPYEDSKFYLVRIDGYERLNKGKICIDYSIPNIHNVTSCGLFEDFAKKMIYIAPLFYDELFMTKEGRKIPILTTFIDIYQPRRYHLLNCLQKTGFNNININNCFSRNDLLNLYKSTNILINIHQTDHHHTFEELRVLSALQCGVIVISEESPLKELIPYSDFIIWTTYEDIINKLHEVLQKYDEIHSRIFSPERIERLSSFHEKNKKELDIRLKSLLENKDKE
jgi:hypothetical protein